MDTKQKFSNLHEAAAYFRDESKCREHLELIRWNGKPACPHCEYDKVYRFKDGKRFKCAKCRKKFTVTVGSIFENTNIPLSKWFLGIYIFINHKKGVSSCQLARDLGITQKAGWHVLHRIREMLKENDPKLLGNYVEADETYVGGKVKNKHASIRKQLKNKMSPLIKTAVLGLLERDKGVFTRVIGRDVNRETMLPIMRERLSPGTMLITDSSHIYTPLRDSFAHYVINHEQGEYVRGFVHTNGIEGFWSILKRTIIGTYHQISPKHLNRYCEEVGFKYNTRKIKDAERFEVALGQCNGRRLKYKELIS